jgi:hypothetical protein
MSTKPLSIGHQPNNFLQQIAHFLVLRDANRSARLSILLTLLLAAFSVTPVAAQEPAPASLSHAADQPVDLNKAGTTEPRPLQFPDSPLPNGHSSTVELLPLVAPEGEPVPAQQAEQKAKQVNRQSVGGEKADESIHIHPLIMFVLMFIAGFVMSSRR